MSAGGESEPSTSVTSAAQEVLRAVLSDEAWQDFGFDRRPVYGAAIQSFRPSWLVKLEKRVLQEMVAVLTAAHLKADAISLSELPALLDLFLDGPEPSKPRPLWESLGYASRDDGRRRLEESVRLYAQEAAEGWPKILFANVDVVQAKDAQLRGRVAVGCVRFGQMAEDIIGFLRRPTG